MATDPLSLVLGDALAAGPARSRRVLVLGDSITFAGGWVAAVETRWLARWPAMPVEVYDLGLSSESIGATDDGGEHERRHGFPRPCLGECLDRALTAVRPHAVIACYGMNDGIGLPPDPGRLAAFQAGVHGLRRACAAIGAPLVLATPTIYDHRGPAAGIHPDYDRTLEAYGRWLLERRADGWAVLDLRTPLAADLARLRAADPAATFLPDGVHPDAHGQWCLGRAVLAGLGDAGAAAAPGLDALLPPALAALPALVRERLEVRRDAWLTLVGHRRPNLPTGLPMHEAEVRIEALSARIDALRRSI